jgi:hypothetical protein
MKVMANWYDLYQEKSHHAIPSLSGFLGLNEFEGVLNNSTSLSSAAAVRTFPSTNRPAAYGNKLSRQVKWRTLPRTLYRSRWLGYV